MRDGNVPPPFVVWATMVALGALVIGVLAGPIFKIAWLALAAAIVAAVTVGILLIYTFAEILISLR